MTGVFNGLAGALNIVFGAPVTITTAAGAVSTVHAVFREEPVEIISGDGRPQVVAQPTLRVQRNQVPAIAVKYLVQPSVAAGRRFKVLRIMQSASPATDAFIYCVLEEVL